MFSADGRWLYFVSDRAGGQGGDDLHRAAVADDGAIGAAENLGPGVNTRGDEWAPTPDRDGRRLLFASDGLPGARRHDLFVAGWNGHAFADAKPVPGIATDADEFDGAWIGDGDGLVFARSADAASKPIRLYVATCRAHSYGDVAPLAVAMLGIALAVRFQATQLAQHERALVEAAYLQSKETELRHYVELAQSAIAPMVRSGHTDAATRQAASRSSAPLPYRRSMPPKRSRKALSMATV